MSRHVSPSAVSMSTFVHPAWQRRTGVPVYPSDKLNDGWRSPCSWSGPGQDARNPPSAFGPRTLSSSERILSSGVITGATCHCGRPMRSWFCARNAEPNLWVCGSQRSGVANLNRILNFVLWRMFLPSFRAQREYCFVVVVFANRLSGFAKGMAAIVTPSFERQKR